MRLTREELIMQLNELLGWEDLRHGTNRTIEAILIAIAFIRLAEVVIR